MVQAVDGKVDDVEVSKGRTCASCKKKTALWCATCHNVWYCSRECQKRDWERHKPTCQVTAVDGERSWSCEWWQSLSTEDIPSEDDKARVYKRLIESYRLRAEQEFVFMGKARGAFNGDTGTPLQDFTRYILIASKMDGFLPPWWDPAIDDRDLIGLACTDPVHNINFTADENGILARDPDIDALSRMAVDIYNRPVYIDEGIDHEIKCSTSAADRLTFVINAIQLGWKDTLLVARSKRDAVRLRDDLIAAGIRPLVMIESPLGDRGGEALLTKRVFMSGVGDVLIGTDASLARSRFDHVNLIINLDAPRTMRVYVQRLRQARSCRCVTSFLREGDAIAPALLTFLRRLGHNSCIPAALFTFAALHNTQTIDYQAANGDALQMVTYKPMAGGGERALGTNADDWADRNPSEEQRRAIKCRVMSKMNNNAQERIAHLVADVICRDALTSNQQQCLQIMTEKDMDTRIVSAIESIQTRLASRCWICMVRRFLGALFNGDDNYECFCHHHLH